MTTFWADIPQPVLDSNGRPVLDSLGHPVFGPPIPAPPAITPEDVRPEPDEVAALSRTRTVDLGGADTGSFSESTHPNLSEVADLIDQAVTDVLGHLPSNVNPAWHAPVKRAICSRAAFTIEVSFFREAAATSGPAQAYGQQFTADLASLQALIPKATHVA